MILYYCLNLCKCSKKETLARNHILRNDVIVTSQGLVSKNLDLVLKSSPALEALKEKEKNDVRVRQEKDSARIRRAEKVELSRQKKVEKGEMREERGGGYCLS